MIDITILKNFNNFICNCYSIDMPLTKYCSINFKKYYIKTNNVWSAWNRIIGTIQPKIKLFNVKVFKK